MSLVSVFRPAAQTDLIQTRDWYEQQKPGLGERFSLAVDEAVTRVEAMPQMYVTVFREIRRVKLRTFPYLIYYRVLFGSNRSYRSITRES